MANLTGKTLGKYEMIERLGKGGMAEVYKAYHPRLDTHAAIKVLYSHLIEEDNFLSRFEREARAVATLKHSNIVRIYDFDIDDETYYMVMDYIDGPPLSKYLTALQQAGKNPSKEFTLKLMKQISSALDYAHGKGMIHRDVKTANILLDSQQNAYLADFGIAHIVSNTQFTATGTLIGTPAYMSPEQCQGLALNASSDIYSLGIMLYEMIVGRTPFDQDTPMAIIHKQIYEPLPKPREINPEVSKPLENVILKAIKKKPEDRYQSAGDLVEDLRLAIDDKDPVISPIQPQTEIFQGDEKAFSEAETAPREKPSELSDMAEAETVPQLNKIEKPAKEDLESDQKPTIPEPEDIAEVETVAMLDGTVEGADQAEDQIETRVALPDQEKLGIQELETEPEKLKRKIPLGTLIGIVAAIIILIISLIFIPPLLSGGKQSAGQDITEPETEPMAKQEEAVPDEPENTLCKDPGECVALGGELWDGGDHLTARDAFDLVDMYITEEERPGFAWTRCEMGELSILLDDIDAAQLHFSECIDWLYDVEDQPLRDYAQERLDTINQPAESQGFEEIICDNIDDCVDSAFTTWKQGDLQMAFDYFAHISTFVNGDDEELPQAWTRCEMGKLSIEMDRLDDAVRHFNECIDWTHAEEGDYPQGLRDFAQEQIEGIENGTIP